MELAGLEPATSWVRSRLAAAELTRQKICICRPFALPVGGAALSG
jgi:hypothetical protein